MENILRDDNSFELKFEEGLLGFEDIKDYVLIFPEEEDGLPFFFLKAVDEDLRFIVCDPILFVPDYKINYDEEILTSLKAQSADELKHFVLATITQDVANTTINLKAPVIFNATNGLAKQFVLNDTDYLIKHKLFEK